MGFREYWGKQFALPHGFGGKIATLLMKFINKKMLRVVQQNLKDNTTILDIGFGDGWALKKLLKQSNSVFYGVDISSSMVKTATKKNKKAIKKGRLHLAKSSAEKIPFAQQFGQIYTMNTVYFWNGLEKTLSEIYKKLEDGGEFLNVFRNKEWLDKLSYTKHGYAKYTEQELMDATERAGFNVELIQLYEGTFCIKAVK